MAGKSGRKVKQRACRSCIGVSLCAAFLGCSSASSTDGADGLSGAANAGSSGQSGALGGANAGSAGLSAAGSLGIGGAPSGIGGAQSVGGTASMGGALSAGGMPNGGGAFNAGGMPAMGGSLNVGGGVHGGGAGAAGNGGTAGAGSATLASYIIGADITSVQAAEARGATYSDGTKRDIFQLLKSHGFNYIRLRTFVDPKAADGYDQQNGYADLAHTVTFGKRIKDAGLGFLLDFHYSDNWATPASSACPWPGRATPPSLSSRRPCMTTPKTRSLS